MSAAVVRANALRLPLTDASVDLIVTSPPYFALRSYRDEGEHYEHQIGSEETPAAFLEALWAVTAECWRVLKPSGSMWVNLGDKYCGYTNGQGKGRNVGGGNRGMATVPDGPVSAPTVYGIPNKSLLGLPWRYAIGCIDGQAAPDGQRWILRAEVIWSKPNGLPESVTDRVRRSHEQWFQMVKSPRYFSAVDEVREAHTAYDRPRGVGGYDGENGQRAHGFGVTQHPLGKLPGSVWTVPSEPLIIPPAVARHYDLPDHFAAFPQELPRRIILGWSPSGICVECGEGRRPVVAKEHHIEPSFTYAEVDGLNNRALTAYRGRRSGEFDITGYACACAGGNPEVYPAPRRPAIVLDPFGGTGTVAMVARTLGRFGVSVDLSADYNRLAQWRIFQSGHGEKAAQRTHRENQGDLFSSPPEPPIEDVVSL